MFYLLLPPSNAPNQTLVTSNANQLPVPMNPVTHSNISNAVIQTNPVIQPNSVLKPNSVKGKNVRKSPVARTFNRIEISVKRTKPYIIKKTAGRIIKPNAPKFQPIAPKGSEVTPSEPEASSSTVLKPIASSLVAVKSVTSGSTAVKPTPSSLVAVKSVTSGSTAVKPIASSQVAVKSVTSASTAVKPVASSLLAVKPMASSLLAVKSVTSASTAVKSVASSLIAVKSVTSVSTALKPMASSLVAAKSVSSRSTALKSVLLKPFGVTTDLESYVSTASSTVAVKPVASGSTAVKPLTSRSTAVKPIKPKALTMKKVYKVSFTPPLKPITSSPFTENSTSSTAAVKSGASGYTAAIKPVASISTAVKPASSQNAERPVASHAAPVKLVAIAPKTADMVSSGTVAPGSSAVKPLFNTAPTTKATETRPYSVLHKRSRLNMDRDDLSRKLFNDEVNQFYKFGNRSIKQQWTRKRISHVINLIEEFKEAPKLKVPRTSSQYHYSHKYDIVLEDGRKILIQTDKGKGEPAVRVVPSEEYYDILSDIHFSTGHGGRDKMLLAFKTEYLIPTSAVNTFLKYCKVCQNKKSYRTASVVHDIFDNRGKVKLINMQETPDGLFKFILLYQDYMSKFSLLRPLTSNNIDEISLELMKIFLEIGCPKILETGSGRQFTSALLKKIETTWPACKMVNGKSRQESYETDGLKLADHIKKLVKNWMNLNKTKNWSIGIYFVQFQVNSSFQRSIEQTPFKAFIGKGSKAGLRYTIPDKEIVKLKTEEDLENYMTQLSKAKETVTEEEEDSVEEVPIQEDLENCMAELSEARESVEEEESAEEVQMQEDLENYMTKLSEAKETVEVEEDSAEESETETANIQPEEPFMVEPCEKCDDEDPLSLIKNEETQNLQVPSNEDLSYTMSSENYNGVNVIRIKEETEDEFIEITIKDDEVPTKRRKI